jgi:hypothetical protein
MEALTPNCQREAMPYSIAESKQCDTSKPWAVIKDSNGEVMGCHATELDATKQLAALYINEGIERAKYDDIDFTPPKGVREEAQKGLDWRKEYKRGGTAVGVARARDLSNAVSVSPETIKRMVSYFARHEVDKQGEGWSPGEDGFPSNGRIAWALWGGDAGQAWAGKVLKSMNARDEVNRIATMPRIQRMFEAPKDGKAVIATETPVEIYDPVRGHMMQVLLMDGVKFRRNRRQLPIVDSHDDATVRNVFGSIRNIVIEDGQLVGVPEFASDEESQVVATRYSEGHLNDFSIDAVILERQYIPEGKSYTTKRGVVIDGPAEIVTAWEPHNASICATGADPNSTVRRSIDQTAQRRAQMDEALMAQLKMLGLPEGVTDPAEIIKFLADKMPEPEIEVEMAEHDKPEEVAREMMGEDKVEKMDVEKEVARRLKADQVRRKTIYSDVKIAKLERSFAEQLIDEGVSVEVSRQRIIQKMATQEPVGTSVRFHESAEDKFASAIGAGLVQRAFRAAGVRRQAQNVPGADEFARMDLRRMATMCVERMGVKTDKLSMPEIARIAMGARGVQSQYRIQRDAYHTTGSFPNLLLDAANKTLLAAYEEATYTWSIWARQAASVEDFKPINRIRLGESPDLEAIPEAQKYPEGAMTDSKTSYQVQKYGKQFSVSWETVINDDLDALSRIPAMHGNAARRLQNKKVYEVLTSNPTMSDGFALFSASHTSGSNVSGGAGAPAVGTLNTGFQQMMLQKGLSGDTILGLTPAFLIVPPGYSATALELVNSQSYNASGNNEGVINIYGVNGVRPLQVVVEPVLHAASTTNWYLAANTNQIDTVELAFLAGEESPVLTSEQDFDTDCYKYNVRQTFGVAAIDWRGLFRNSA